MLVSFVIPSKNCVAWLPMAVESCFKQTHSDIEIIIVDDCSVDLTLDYTTWIQTYDKRVKVFTSNNPLGRSAARNLGNSMTTGKIICVLDADDYCHPNRVKLTIEKMNKGFDFIYGSAEAMNCLGKRLGILEADKFDLEKSIKDKTNRIVHSTVAYTKDIASKFPYSKGEISDLGLDDWEQQIRLFTSGIKSDFIPNILSAYRILQNSISETRNPKKVLEVKNRILEGLKIPA